MSKNAKQATLENVQEERLRLRELGFTERPLKALTLIATSASSSEVRRAAAREIALWHANRRSPEHAKYCLKWLEQHKDGNDNPEQLRLAFILEAESLSMLGDHDQGRAVITKALTTLAAHSDLMLAAANLAEDNVQRLSWINKALHHHQLAPLALQDSSKAPLLDRLQPLEALNSAACREKVSILIPAYNCATTLSSTLDSLLGQTWTNLEILIVDDQSSDDTLQVAKHYAQRDNRIRVMHRQENSGPYVCRNQALAKATGEFVTVHDTDDWSHPSLIERQVTHLKTNPQVIANIPQQSRVTEDLRFYRRGTYGSYLAVHFPGVMFRRRPVCKALGYWDSVRFGGDHEYIRRMRAFFGSDKVVNLNTGLLCFQRQHQESLTSSSDFGIEGFYFGARREYYEAQIYHHATASTLYYKFPQNERPFPLPLALQLSPQVLAQKQRHFHVILVSDYRDDGYLGNLNQQQIHAYRRTGLRIGLIHLPIYEANPRSNIHLAIREHLKDPEIQLLVHGESASCDTLVVLHPAVLQEAQRYKPKIEARDLRVLVTTPPNRHDSTGYWQPQALLTQLQAEFGKSGIWHPLGPVVRAQLATELAAQDANLPLSNEDWIGAIQDEFANLLESGNQPAVQSFVQGFKETLQHQGSEKALEYLLDCWSDRGWQSWLTKDMREVRPFWLHELLNSIYLQVTQGKERIKDHQLVTLATQGHPHVAVVFSQVALTAGRFSSLGYLYFLLLLSLPKLPSIHAYDGVVRLFMTRYATRSSQLSEARQLSLRMVTSASRKMPHIQGEAARTYLLAGLHDKANQHFDAALQALRLPAKEQQLWRDAFACLCRLITGQAPPKANQPQVQPLPPPTQYRKLLVSGFVYSGSGALYDYLREFSTVNSSAPLELTLLESQGGIGDWMDHLRNNGKIKPSIWIELFFRHLWGICGLNPWMEAKHHQNACTHFIGSWDQADTANLALRQRGLKYVQAVSSLLNSLELAIYLHQVQRPAAARQAFNDYINRLLALYDIPSEQWVLLDNYLHPNQIHRLDDLDDAYCAVVTRDPRSQYVSIYFEHQKFNQKLNSFINGVRQRWQTFSEMKAKMELGDRVVQVSFESLVQEPAYCKQLAIQLGLNPADHQGSKYFYPQESEKNIMNFKDFFDQNAIQKIEAALPEYLQVKDT